MVWMIQKWNFFDVGFLADPLDPPSSLPPSGPPWRSIHWRSLLKARPRLPGIVDFNHPWTCARSTTMREIRKFTNFWWSNTINRFYGLNLTKLSLNLFKWLNSQNPRNSPKKLKYLPVRFARQQRLSRLSRQRDFRLIPRCTPLILNIFEMQELF